MALQNQYFNNTNIIPILYQYLHTITQYQNPKILICIDITTQSFDSQTMKLIKYKEMGDPFLVSVRSTYLTNRSFLNKFTILLTNSCQSNSSVLTIYLLFSYLNTSQYILDVLKQLDMVITPKLKSQFYPHSTLTRNFSS